MSTLKRPLGVTIIAILSFIGGIAGIGSGASLLASTSMLFFVAQSGALIGTAVASIPIGIISLFVGWGLWQGKAWAWRLALIINFAGIVISAISVALGGTGAAVSIAISVVIIYYLTRPHVKAFFGKGPPVTTA